ncbi:MAG: NPCBM/NEW2 domain-containing protein [Sedimentisphaerales bacterium]|nr:NPCBM/NEW2 domain-containing protein [Sedimentisphaerales bacterium]
MTESAFNKLLFRLLDGQITPEELRELELFLQSDPNAIETYVRFMSTSESLRQFGQTYNDSIWPPSLQEFGEYEKAAPCLDVNLIPQLAQEIPVAKAIVPVPQDRKINKTSMVTLILSLAACLVIFVYIKLNPYVPLEVATVTDSMNAFWADSGASLPKGCRVRAGQETLYLTKGIIKLLYDNGTEAVIEGPAEFRIPSDNRIQFNHGSIFVSVALEGIGFTINTTNAKIVDMGTEFGVLANPDGTSEVHMLDGQALVVPLSKEQTKQVVSEGMATRVDRNAVLQTIPLKTNVFVRALDSKNQSVWRGHDKLYLADIVSGGSGFDAFSDRNAGIDLKTGHVVVSNREIVGGDRGDGYTPVPDIPFVDGVFVPDGGDGPVVVSSAGHTYDKFGDTGGIYYIPIGANRNIYVNYQNDLVLARLFLKRYSSEESSTLCLHANAGITFDLQKIREQVPARIRQFSTAYGISWNDSARTSIASDFFILVDGQARMVSSNVSEADGGRTVVIPLNETDRFLTLVCTEGQENAGDWALFVNPVLELE